MLTCQSYDDYFAGTVRQCQRSLLARYYVLSFIVSKTVFIVKIVLGDRSKSFEKFITDL